MNDRIIPKVCRKDARAHFSADIEAWKNFAQRITKNSFVREFLLERDGDRCSWCRGKFLRSKVIHHLSYEHFCSYNHQISIPSPTSVNPFRKRLVPDCKSCKADNNERFLACTSRLALVHYFCNKRIAEIPKSSIQNISENRDVAPMTIPKNY